MLSNLTYTWCGEVTWCNPTVWVLPNLILNTAILVELLKNHPIVGLMVSNHRKPLTNHQTRWWYMDKNHWTYHSYFLRYRRAEGRPVREATWERSQDNVEGAKRKGRQQQKINYSDATVFFANEQLAGPGEAGEEEDWEEGEVGGVEGEDHQDDWVRPPAERVPG